MSVKIQINSLEALERLIGGDTQLEIDIRQSIVQEFSKKYLKNVATEEVVRNAKHATQKDVEDTFFDIVRNGYRNDLVLKPEIREKLMGDLRSSVNTALRQLIEEVIEEVKVKEKIKEKLELAAKWVIDDLSKETLEKRLNIMVDNKLKEKLGLK
jgi:hypothetical protein